jgi:hypothetical protein
VTEQEFNNYDFHILLGADRPLINSPEGRFYAARKTGEDNI